MNQKIENAYAFLDGLKKENEAELVEKLCAMKDVEQHILKLESKIEEIRKKKDPHIDLFSPIGLHSLSNSEIELERELEEYQSKLPDLERIVQEQQEKNIRLEEIRCIIQEQKDQIAELQEKREAKVQLYFLEEQELDRNRIARDLHDSTVQNLTMLVHKTELCTRLLNVDNVRVMLELQTMIENIKMTIDDMREIIYNLRPMSLSNLGLAATLESYCTHIKRNHNIETDFVLTGEEPNILQIQKITLYRIVQEACNNTVKYAKATKIQIELNFLEEEIEVVIRDNGVGFDKEKKMKQTSDQLHGFGLSIMRERTNLLEGQFEIQSAPKKGTTVRIIVPIKIEKEELYE